jgi:protein TonB
MHPARAQASGATVIVIEFIVFVVSSGVFYHQRFRHHLWAVIVAGAVATGSSLLFFYDVYEKLQAHPEAPVKVVKVKVPVVERVSRAPELSKPENCRRDYPFLSRILGDEGTTELAFTVLADGTVSAVKVAKTSGSDRLDDAAVECVSKWHYRPALKDSALVDAPVSVKVVWKLGDGDQKTPAPAGTVPPEKTPEGG